jgi:hypothetical protein
MKAEEEGFGPRRRCSDPGSGLLTQYVRDVARLLDGDLAFVEIVFAAVTDVSAYR